MPDLELKGCTPEPLMAYLKALGVLRLVSEQKDPEARGWWKNDMFWLRSKLDEEALKKFFLEEYKPTLVISPWNADSGFIFDSGKAAKIINDFKKEDNPRLQAICDAVSAAKDLPILKEFRQILKRKKQLSAKKKNISNEEKKELGELEKRRKKVKQVFISNTRNELPDAGLDWLDCCFKIGLKKLILSPLMGTGGLDGQLEFSSNFLSNCQVVLSRDKEDKYSQLENALFAKAAPLEASSTGQFSPGQVSAPNNTQGFEGKSLSNPWDFILMMEGALLLAGAAVKRYNNAEEIQASFPFVVLAVATGFNSSSKKDEIGSRGELWLPLWARPATLPELRQLFSEGRAEVSGRPARNGTDFARAVASLGVDRGLTAFQRVGFLKRSGRSFLATPLGRFEVIERRGIDLLREVDPWLDSFRKATSGKEAPPRFVSALRQIESAIFDFCKYGGNTFFQRILIALGTAERELALTSGKIGDSEQKVHPLAGLSPEWIKSANDDSQEFTIALALASIWDEKIGTLRTNLEPVNVWFGEGRQQASWAEKERHVVWNSTDLFTNLANTLERRIMDGNRQNSEHLPIGSSYYAPLDAVAAFLAGNPDYSRIEELLWGLILVDTSKKTQDKAATSSQEFILPREYALLKLLFLPRPLVPEHSGNGIKWRLANVPRNGIVIRPEPRILPLLRAGRIGEACRIAAQRLRSSGLVPMPGFLPCGRARDEVWADRPADPKYGLRLAATLLIPICSEAVDKLVKLVCRADESEAAEALMSERGGV